MSWLDKILTEMKGAVAPEPEDEGLFGGAVEAPPKDPMSKYIDPVENNRSLLDYIRPNKVPKGGSGRGQVNPPIAGSVAQKVDSVFNNLIQTESTGVHRTKDGKLLESPRGALGVTQVMRKTGADPGYGVAPLKDQTEQEYIRFGKDLLTAYTKNYDGDIAKGLAAYNYGPGKLDKLIKKHGDSWRENLPAETRNYLNKIIGKSYGNRVDGTQKGSGFFGELPMRDGSNTVATEISVGVNIDKREMEIPLLTPNQPKKNIDALLKGGKVTDDMVRIAVEHARTRIKEGKNPFAQKGESTYKVK